MTDSGHDGATIEEQLHPADVDAVLALADRAERADEVGPLSDHARLHLRRGGGTDLVARTSGGQVAGYAHLDGAEAELVVDPRARRHGVGGVLLDELERRTPAGDLRVWAHGNLPPAVALAAARGYEPVRELGQMSRSLVEPLPSGKPLDGLRLRAFRPGQDEEQWLGVNARAFAHHPEQGGWTADDLADREGTDWFDPEGLLVAEAPDGTMAGFHWTKVHHPAGAEALGEVYVLAVDPAYQGRGLGPALTLAGLRHLAGLGLSAVMLYVDGDNEPAIATYRRLGFERVSLDVMYARAR